MQSKMCNMKVSIVVLFLKVVYSSSFNPFQGNYPHLYPLKASEKFDFLIILEGIERERWPEMINVKWFFLENFQKVSSLTHFSPMSHFYTFWKLPKTYGFLTFSRDVEM